MTDDENVMTIKKWYPDYNVLKRFMIFIKYLFSGYKKEMALDCYLYYRFDILPKNQRQGILMDHEIMQYEAKLNDNSVRYIFNDKKEFYNVFSDYMKRKILFINDCSFDEFCSFFKEQEVIAVKPVNMYGGKGFRIVRWSDYNDASLLKEYQVLKEGNYIAEEYLINDESYRKIYSKSLNTVRVNTIIKKDGMPYIFAIVNQFGSSGSITDNDEECGIWSASDVESGIICAAEKDDETAVYYNIHPDTGENIIGFKNERIDEIKKLALELALKVKKARLVGWDIAVTDKGIELVEGNVTPELGVFEAMTGYNLRALFEQEIL